MINETMTAARELPTDAITILGVKYGLYSATTMETESGPMLGYSDNLACSITLATKEPSQLLYVLLHEILHTLSFMGHLQFLRLDDNPYKDDEARVDAVASLLADTLQRNPDLFICLLSSAKGTNIGENHE